MTKQSSDLDWQAFQYIAGELSSDDAARFEARLAIDQAAREAVAAAVGLSEIAAIAECQSSELVSPSASAIPQPLRVRSWAWMGWAAAACLLVITFAQQLAWSPWSSQRAKTGDSMARSASSPSDGSSSGLRAHAAPDLALAWVHTRTSVSSDDGLDDDPQVGEDRLRTLDAPAIEEPRLEEAVISAPSWMVTAVAGLDVYVSQVE